MRNPLYQVRAQLLPAEGLKDAAIFFPFTANTDRGSTDESKIMRDDLADRVDYACRSVEPSPIF
jgi:hypothetical protein